MNGSATGVYSHSTRGPRRQDATAARTSRSSRAEAGLRNPSPASRMSSDTR